MTAETSNARGEWVLVPMELLDEARNIAMEWTVKGRVPECGKFGQIAQDLDAMLAAAPPPPPAAAQQQAVATPLPGDKGSVQALFNPTLQPMQQGGGEDAPPSAPVGVEDVVMAARNAENAIRNCAAAGQIGEGYVQYADDLRDAVQRLAQQPAAGVVDDTRRIRALADNYWRLEPFDMPTPGGDDADVGWRVIEFHRAEPRERVVVEHYRDNPREAIDAALAAQRQEPTT